MCVIETTDYYIEQIGNSVETENYTAICGAFVRYCSRHGSLAVCKAWNYVAWHRQSSLLPCHTLSVNVLQS